MIHLTLAKEQDLPVIKELAYSIWNAHYVDIIGQEQVNYMLNKMYDEKSLLQQINEKKHVFYLIRNGQEVAGFISISTENKLDYWIHKFYISQQTSNRGVGTLALDALINTIRPKRLTLTVNRQNFKSINFYFKNGFKIDRIEDFDIGHGYKMNDFVMIKSL